MPLSLDGTAGITVSNFGSGTVGNGPAFSAYQSTLQSLPANGVWTKVQLQSKDFADTAGGVFDATTNYRFTPSVAGYYQINGSVGIVGAQVLMMCAIYKNGSPYKLGTYGTTFTSNVAALVYLNGTSDYVELYAYNASASAVNTNASASTVTGMNGFLARNA